MIASQKGGMQARMSESTVHGQEGLGALAVLWHFCMFVLRMYGGVRYKEQAVLGQLHAIVLAAFVSM